MRRGACWLLALALWAGLAAAADEPAAVEKRMRQRLAQRPGDTDARFELARTLARQQKFQAATAEYARLLKAHPDNPDYLLGLAQVKLWSGQPKDALPRLAQARKLAPRYADVRRVEIQALLALGDTAGARALRDEARRQFPAEDWAFAQIDTPPAPAPAAPARPVETVAAPTPAVPPRPTPAAVPAPPAPTSVAAPAPAPAAPPVPTARNEIEAGFSHEHLTRGLPSWRSRYLLGERHGTGDTLLYGGLRETDRYALIDREVHAGFGLPATPSLRLQIEAGASGTHRILPAHYGAAQFQFQPAAGWTLTGGWRRSAYDLGMTGVVHLGADRYLGNERFSYTLYSGGPDGSGSSPSHRLQWAHYYGERDWAGIAVNAGRETESLGSAGFLTSRVSGLTLAGRHGLGGDWALVWEAGRVRQGDAYTRSGARLGLRYAF